MKNDPTNSFQKSLDCLNSGGLLLYPSDTLWGLGCDATNQEAIQKIYKLKQRSDSKSLITLVSSIRMLQNAVKNVPEVVWDILEFSTEPLTIIYPEANPSYKHLTSTDGSIAIRLVESGWTKILIDKFRKPIISTSANISGSVSPLFFEEISSDITEAVDYMTDEPVGLKLTGRASKLMKIGEDGTVKIFR